MNINLKTIGTIMEIGGAIGLCISAIRAENKRHKATMDMLDAKAELANEKINSSLKDFKIALLESKLRLYESKLKEKEQES